MNLEVIKSLFFNLTSEIHAPVIATAMEPATRKALGASAISVGQEPLAMRSLFALSRSHVKQPLSLGKSEPHVNCTLLQYL